MTNFSAPDDDEDWDWQNADLPDPSDPDAVDQMIIEPTTPEGAFFDQIRREEAETQINAALMCFPERRWAFMNRDRTKDGSISDLYSQFVPSNGDNQPNPMDIVANGFTNVQPSNLETNEGQEMFSGINIKDFNYEDFEFEPDPVLDHDMDAGLEMVGNHPGQPEEHLARPSMEGIDNSSGQPAVRQSNNMDRVISDLALPKPATQPVGTAATYFGCSSSSTPMELTPSAYSMSAEGDYGMGSMAAVNQFNASVAPLKLALPTPAFQSESTPATTTTVGWSTPSPATIELTPSASPMTMYTSMGSLSPRGTKRAASEQPEGNHRARRVKKNTVANDIDIDEDSRNFLDIVKRQMYSYPGDLQFDNIESIGAALERLQGLYKKPSRECTFPGPELGADNTFPQTAADWKPYVELVMKNMMDWSSYIEWNQVVPKVVKDERDQELITTMAQRSRNPNAQGNTLEARDLMPPPHIQARYLQDIPRQQKIVLGRPSNAFDAECLAWLLVKYAQDAQKGQTHSRPWTTKMDSS